MAPAPSAPHTPTGGVGGRPGVGPVAAGIVLVGALLLAACSGADSAELTSPARPAVPAPGPERTGFPPDWQPPPLDWGPCPSGPDDVECATLRVPRDWSAPDGPTVDLAVGRVRATGDRLGTVVTNPGGPGASGVEFLAYAAVSEDLAERFDQVSWDPRGVGASDPVRCDTAALEGLLGLDPSPDDAGEQAALDGAAATVAAGCAPTDAALLAHVSTTDAARDLEALRRALDDGPLDFVGYSYGTAIGLRYLELFPRQVRTMVLDGVVDPAEPFEDFLAAQARAFEAALERQADACARAGTEECGVADLTTAYDDVAARAEATPIPAAGGPVGPSEVATAALATLYSPDGWAELGPALRDARAGRGTPLRRLAEGFWDAVGFGGYAAVVCTDTPPPRGPDAYRAFAERLRAESPRFGASVANELAPCATWPTAPTGDAAPLDAPGAPPVLVIGNTGDPATPYANAVAVAARLPGSVLVTVEADGHTAYGSLRCVDEVVDRYVTSGAAPSGPVTCP